MAMLAQKPANNKVLNSKIRRLQSLITLRRLVIEGRSYEECQQVLGLSKRSFYRYLHSLFQEDKKALTKLNESEIVRQASILKARYLSIYQTLGEISKDTTLDPEARLHACGALAELSRSIAKIYSEAPAFVAAQQNKNNNKNFSQEFLAEALAYSNRRRQEEAPYYYAGYERNVVRDSSNSNSSSGNNTSDEQSELQEEEDSSNGGDARNFEQEEETQQRDHW